MTFRKFATTLVAAITIFQVSAKEGMWIPTLLGKYNIAEMQAMGFKLTAKDIYDVNHASMKDAVVLFGRGCTGEMISNEGLVITNHHCGYGQIQQHSSVEHDYLTNGFWAMNRDEELPNKGLTVSFLEYMDDVTERVLDGTAGLDEKAGREKIGVNINSIIKEASEKGKYNASIKPLFYGNQYFLYVYKVFRDVRLVGAPPSAIGKFGGDTDNWMWPRHTGDFSLFRVYADKNNEPADYSPDNVPYQPKKFFPVSMKGVQPGDFTLVFGNPGSTTQYWPHQAVAVTMDQRDPDRIALRDIKLSIIGSDMERDPAIRIQYAAKYAYIANAWKKWQGEIRGLEGLDAVNKKIESEKQFQQWARQNGSWESTYRPVFENFDQLYSDYAPFIQASDYYSEVVLRGVELFQLAQSAQNIINAIENKREKPAEVGRKAMENALPGFFKDYNQSTDEKLFATLMPRLVDKLERRFVPAETAEVIGKYGADELVEKVYRKSVLSNQVKLEKLLRDGSDQQILKLRKDPIVQMFRQLNFLNETEIAPNVRRISADIDSNMKIYMAGLMEMNSDRAFYPDANLTLRVGYGKVEGFEPADGVEYKYYTTLSGIIAKDNPDIYDYRVPAHLKELYREKDFGKYAVNGDVPVAFLASNHTTGGNSGSPVINANGELIGVNFDRCWESTMSDIMYDPDMCRNISIDIRYALFIIDKFAGAGYLLDEMEIVGDGSKESVPLIKLQPAKEME